MLMPVRRLHAWTFATLVAIAAAACGDSSGLELRGGVQVSFATRGTGVSGSAPALSRMAALDDTVTSGADTIIITSVELVLREIELEPLEVADCDFEPEPPGCEDVEVGPVLIDLPLTPGAEQKFAVEVPPGTYVEVEFDIHKVSGDDPADAQFRQEHPDFIDKSIRVRGTYNGVDFTFETDVNVEQELDLVPAIVLQESGLARITIFTTLRTWFRASDGSLLDPTDGQNKSQIDNNIQKSFQAFEDDDGDGNPGS